MAINLGSVYGTLEMRTEKWKQGAQEAKADLDNLEKSTNTRLASIGQSFTKAGMVLTAGLTVPIVAFGVKAVKTFAEFEQSMANTFSVMGDATDEAKEKLTALAEQLGRDTAFKAKEAAEAMYYLASAGLAVDEIFGTLPAVLDLAAATQSDLAFASEQVVANLGRFKIEASDSARVADVMAKGISASQLTIQRLADFMPYAGIVASQFNGTLEDTIGIGAVLSETWGAKMPMAGAGLQAMFRKMTLGGGDVDKVLSSLGLTMEEVNPAKIGMTNSIYKLVEAFGKVEDPILKSQMAAKLFGDQGLRVFDTLEKVGVPAIKDMILSMEDAEGAAAKMAEIQLDTIAGQWKIFGSSVENLMIQIKKAVDKGALKDFVTSMINLVNSIANLPEPVLKAIVVIAGLLAAIGPILLTIGLFITKFLPALKVGLLALKGPFIFLKGALLSLSASLGLPLLPLLAIIAAIIAVGVALFALYKHSEKFRNFVDGIVNSVKNMAIKVTNWFGITSTNVADEIVKMSNESVGEVIRMTSSMQSSLLNLSLSGKKISGDMRDKFVSNVTDMKNKSVQAINDGTVKAIEDLTYLKDEAEFLTEETYNSMVETVKTKGKEQIVAQEDISKAIIEKLNKLKDDGVVVTDEMRKDIVNSLIQQRDQSISVLSEGQVQATAVMESLRASKNKVNLEMLADTVAQSASIRDAQIKDAEDEYKRKIEAIIRLRDDSKVITDEQARVMIEGATLEKDELIKLAEETHIGVTDEITDMADENAKQIDMSNGKILSDFSVFKKELIDGFSNLGKTVNKNWDLFLAGLRWSFNEYKNDLLKKFAELPGKIWDALSTLGSTIKSSFTDAWDTLVAELKTWPTKIWDWGKSIAQSFIDGFKDALKEIGKAFKKGLEDGKKMMESESPPKEGPLKDIDTWGFNIGSAWVEGFQKAFTGFALPQFPNLNVAPASLPSNTTTITNSPHFAVNVGIYAGSEMEKRALAKELAESYNDYQKSIGGNL